MSRIVLFVLTLLGAATLAACGGGGGGDALTKEEYGQSVAQAGDALAQAFEELSTKAAEAAGDITSGDDLTAMMDQLAGVLGDAATSVSDAADELAGLNPPDDAEEANDQLVEGLQTLAADVEELQAAVEEGDFANVLDLAAQFQEIASSEAGTQIQSAIDELKGLGYDVEGSD